METQVRTPQMVFMQPQRLVVPLFQRPYVWNQENQWEPLWDDVVRVTDRVLNGPSDTNSISERVDYIGEGGDGADELWIALDV
jgi:hypothetical protein